MGKQKTQKSQNNLKGEKQSQKADTTKLQDLP